MPGQLPSYLTSYGPAIQQIFQGRDKFSQQEEAHSQLPDALDDFRADVLQMYRAFRLHDEYKSLLDGAARFPRSCIDLGNYVLQIILCALPYATPCDCDYTFDLPNAHFAVNTEPEPLAVILLHLLSNACRFSVPGSVIRTEMRRDTDSVQIAVYSNGLALTEKARGRVFDPYFTYPSFREFIGLGLGLTVSRLYAGYLGGTLELLPGALQGSYFVLTLPLKERQLKDAEMVMIPRSLVDVIMSDAHPVLYPAARGPKG